MDNFINKIEKIKNIEKSNVQHVLKISGTFEHKLVQDNDEKFNFYNNKIQQLNNHIALFESMMNQYSKT